MKGSRGLILNLSGSASLTLRDVDAAMQHVYNNTHPDVNVILGLVIDPSWGQTIRATIIATDFVDGTVLKARRMEVPESKLKAESISGLEPPAFMNRQPEKMPSFTPHADFAVPKFSPVPPRRDKK